MVTTSKTSPFHFPLPAVAPRKWLTTIEGSLRRRSMEGSGSIQWNVFYNILQLELPFRYLATCLPSLRASKALRTISQLRGSAISAPRSLPSGEYMIWCSKLGGGVVALLIAPVIRPYLGLWSIWSQRELPEAVNVAKDPYNQMMSIHCLHDSSRRQSSL